MINIIRNRRLRARQGGVADFGLSLWARGRLSDAVNFGASFAYAGGPSGSTAAVQTAVQNAANSSLAGTTVSVTGPACYCLSGTPVSTPAAAACGSTCSGNITPGKYVMINATYIYSPILPLYSEVASTSLNEFAVVRVQ
jgi:hypothetical protein